MPENDETHKVRADFMRWIESYPLPSEQKFGKERIKSVSRDYNWPMHHPSMVQALKDQDEWMNNPRREQE